MRGAAVMKGGVSQKATNSLDRSDNAQNTNGNFKSIDFQKFATASS